MSPLRFLTAGESHGRGLVGILEGIPAGLALEAAFINAQLERRQGGHGRGGRMKIEKDEAEIVSGVRRGKTLGSPISLLVWNRDWKNWSEAMRVEPGGDEKLKSVKVPRPGHADYVGGVKYGHSDLRNVLERASARETAMRVAVGSVARKFLLEFGVHVASRVVSIGAAEDDADAEKTPVERLNEAADASPVRCLGKKAEREMVAAIDAAKAAGDTVGGVFEVRTSGLPVGLGSYAQWDRRLEGELAKALLSLNAIKGVELGDGFGLAAVRGSLAQDEMDPGRPGVRRRTGHSGGTEGGMSTGEVLRVRAAMKPISTIPRALATIDTATGESATAHHQRSDVCAVPAAGVVAEAMVGLVLAEAVLEKFGGDSVTETARNVAAYLADVQARGLEVLR